MLHRSGSRRQTFLPRFLWMAGGLALAGAQPAAQVGTVRAEQKISETVGGFVGDLTPSGFFGSSVAALGDLDGDGVGDLAVGVPVGDTYQGAVWILFLNPDGTVASEQKIGKTAGGFGGVLRPGDYFGTSVAALGDLNGDGVGDLAVGTDDSDGGSFQGSVWILFLNSDGTVAFEQKVSETAGGFGGVLAPDDRFGSELAALGDLDGDGAPELAVSAPRDDDVLPDQGSVWILSLNPDGTVASERKISATEGGFGGVLEQGNEFGTGLAALGDLDGDGVGDLAVGAHNAGRGPGAVWILFLNSDGTVASEQKIGATERGLFGSSVDALGDLDGDGVGDLAVGAFGDDDGGSGQGAVWILFLNPDGTVASRQKISATEGGFAGDLDPGDFFGISVASLGDLDGDHVGDLAVGANRDDDGGPDQGAVWILFLEGPEIEARLDIRPGTCPNSINRKSHGVLPVALLGAEGFDVTMVDLASLGLSRADGSGGSVPPVLGPPEPHPTLEDVGMPFPGEACECHDLAFDGLPDLLMHFRTDELVSGLLLEELPSGAMVELVARGKLIDGTPFHATDCVRLVPPGTLPGSLSVAATVPTTWIDVEPRDDTLDGGGFADFRRSYPLTSVVTLVAPGFSGVGRFECWSVDGESRPSGLREIQVTVAGDHSLVAQYTIHQRAQTRRR